SSEQAQYLEQVKLNQEKMQRWVQYAPMNYQYKYDLVEAETARVLGQNERSLDLYENAIATAIEHGNLQDEALACELAAEFHRTLKREKIAKTYMTDAYYAYIRWGAIGKAKDLELKYPELILRSPSSKADGASEPTTLTTDGYRLAELDFATVIKASQAISSEILLDHLLAKLMKIALENAGAQKGYFILSNAGELTIEATGEIGQEQGGTKQESLSADMSELMPATLVNYVARTQSDVVLGNATRQGIFTADPYIVAQQPKSVLCAPIIDRGKLLGIIYLENNLIVDAFTPQHLEVLKVLAAQAAISIENALLYRTLEQKVEERTAQLAQANSEITMLNELLKAENLRLSAELEITRRLQQMILPKELELAQVTGLDIAGFMEPADEVGGDYYDVLNRSGKIKIGIGDVTGHGLESGVLMLMAQTAVRTLLEGNFTNSQQFLNIINRTIYQNAQRMNCDKSMTLALLDYEDGLLKLSGQHEEMIIVRSSGEVELIDTADLGFPIALVEEIADFVDQVEVRLHSGDVVVLYSDGITEALDVDKRQYKLERLVEVVRLHRGETATKITQAVMEDVKGHMGMQKVEDDITILVMKQR
ncbi:MAG: SpoIIE family protein phosphatase, partial [Actinomycetota bacterium]